MKNLVKRFAKWLARAVEVETVTSIPVGKCDHSVDTEVQARKLVASVQDPMQFARALAQSACCEGNLLALVAGMAYELAGQVLADTGDDDTDSEYTACTHADFDPEIVCFRLVLAEDIDMLANTISHARGCATCLSLTLLTLAQGHQRVLNATQVDWKTFARRELLARLDESR
jgi:hypothetical protein